MERNPDLDNLVFLSIELGVPVGRLRQELTKEDYQLYRVYYKRKVAREQNQHRMQKMRNARKGRKR